MLRESGFRSNRNDRINSTVISKALSITFINAHSVLSRRWKNPLALEALPAEEMPRA
jgi:hypothetical protein